MPRLTRRRALTAAAALASGAGAGAGAQAAAAPGAAAHDHGSPDSPSPAPSSTSSPSSPSSFDEVYKGRRIQGRPSTGGGHHHGTGYAVFVDGVELHVMRNADGSWISVVSHYDPVPTPRAAARAAVDELQGAKLVPFPAN
ncbi:Tyrosinase cofactor [Streptomyces lincolnensis]|uniref:Tyrosinase cofactor n=1 Tax=Streptomyces lincolnensis TaxID=1915 RepID=A0A1B1M230_STRLN|nr:tyrosinase cofactor [Streptomyces lincolnensis]ANS62716.1 Tyrosinase cofactor [Streptomyces lincolnensis]AXG51641.1 Tyrosinase cofactor [Streptomyces lincolnensis]QMV04662.1 tyrosinase [Streptomyces lincolnensis]